MNDKMIKAHYHSLIKIYRERSELLSPKAFIESDSELLSLH